MNTYYVLGSILSTFYVLSHVTDITMLISRYYFCHLFHPMRKKGRLEGYWFLFVLGMCCLDLRAPQQLRSQLVHFCIPGSTMEPNPWLVGSVSAQHLSASPSFCSMGDRSQWDPFPPHAVFPPLTKCFLMVCSWFSYRLPQTYFPLPLPLSIYLMFMSVSRSRAHVPTLRFEKKKKNQFLLMLFSLEMQKEIWLINIVFRPEQVWYGMLILPNILIPLAGKVAVSHLSLVGAGSFGLPLLSYIKCTRKNACKYSKACILTSLFSYPAFHWWSFVI